MGFIAPADGSADVFVHRSKLLDGQSLVLGSKARERGCLGASSIQAEMNGLCFFLLFSAGLKGNRFHYWTYINIYIYI